MKALLHTWSTRQLEQRRDELLYAAGVLEERLRTVQAALCAREPHGTWLPDGTEHGTYRGYRAGCHCTCCCAANSRHVTEARQRQRERRETVSTPHPKIGRPRVELVPGPNGMVFAQCGHCSWQEGPSVKTYMQERAAAHRRLHRDGQAPVTR